MTVDEMERSIKIENYDPTPGENRCDKCGARAYARTMFLQEGKWLSLEWCGHHFSKFEPTLAADGWISQSRLDILNHEMSLYKKASDDKF